MVITGGAIGAVMAGAFGVAVVSARQDASFRTNTRTVQVYATVLDKFGRLIPDLTKDDFEVYDNGKRQAVTVFKNEIQPITVVLLVDRSGSMVWIPSLVQGAVEQFITKNLLPADKARLGTFGSTIAFAPPEFTNDHTKLLEELHSDMPPAGAAPLWNATSAAMDALAHQEGRRVVLIFSYSKDAPDKTAGVTTSLKDVSGHSQADGIVVYAIGLKGTLRLPVPGEMYFQGQGRGGRGTGRVGPAATMNPVPTTATPDPGLKTLTDDSGGNYFELEPADGLDSTFAHVADELHHQYLLAFDAASLDGRSHKLEVRVNRPNVVVRTRKSYVAATGTGK